MMIFRCIVQISSGNAYHLSSDSAFKHDYCIQHLNRVLLRVAFRGCTWVLRAIGFMYIVILLYLWRGEIEQACHGVSKGQYKGPHNKILLIFDKPQTSETPKTEP